MNKFLTFAGTQPVYLGDVDFMQNAVGAAMTQLARALMDSASNSLNAILQGVQLTRVSSGQVRYSSGVVVIGGEILPVASETIAATTSQTLYFHVVSSLSGERTFKDGNSHQCYDTRAAVINTTSAGGVAVSDVPRLHVASDDHVYPYYSISGFITNAHLVRKNGFWFLDAALNVENDSELVTCAAFFVNLSQEHYDSFSEMSFPAPAVLYNETDGNKVQQIACTITKGNDAVGFTLTLTNAVYGTGDLRVFIPIF